MRVARRTAPLEPKLERPLRAYATAATAAGVGLLALTCPAGAKIIYIHANEKISPNHAYPLDLNHDGKIDFTFVDSQGASSFGGGWGILTVFPNRSANEIRGRNASTRGLLRYASALAPGVRVGPKGQLLPGERIMLQTWLNQGDRPAFSTYCYGPWKQATNRYLGLKFMIQGKTHYGWARLNASCSYLIVTATLTGYAYETIPNKSIITGDTKGPDVITVEPATLGRLALGRK